MKPRFVAFRGREPFALVRLRLSKALLGAAGAQAMMGESIAFERGVPTKKIAEAERLALPTRGCH